MERRDQAAIKAAPVKRRAVPGGRVPVVRKDSGRDRARASGDAGKTARRSAAPKAPETEKRGRKSVAATISGVSPRTVIILALFVLFVVLSVSPVSRNLEANTRLNRLEGELKNQKAVTESLERDVGEAGTLDYVEKEARKQRLVAPGEILYLVTTDDDSENEVKYRVKAIQSKEEAWARVRQMLHSVPRGQ